MENKEIMALWLMVRTQWEGGGMGVIGLKYSEVRRFASDMNIPLSYGNWSKIKVLENFELKRQANVSDSISNNKRS